LKYSDSHPETFWIQKNNEHRGIQVEIPGNLNLNKSKSFVQQFISKPLLIDNRKFDIGIYTLITSTDPLIVYTFHGEALLRFCTENYYPFDTKKVEKYVIGDDYTPIWDMPSLKPYYNKGGFTRKESLNAYIRKKLKKNPDVIWNQIDNIIRQVMLEKKINFLIHITNLQISTKFFRIESIRFCCRRKFCN